MRVITGTAKGLKLETLDGLDTRPTVDRVKEAIFSMIQFEIEGRKVLDLFAGSGQMGIEALSRGAAFGVFVDINPEAVGMIRSNLAHTNLLEKASVAAGDFEQFLRHTKAVFDIAFLDPPYRKGMIARAVPLLVQHMAPNGVIVCESAREEGFATDYGDFSLAAVRSYGKIGVGVYRRAQVQ